MTIAVSYPFNLQNGTTADATQVMANFLQIQNDVNANAAHNGANSDITSLTALSTPLSLGQGGTGGTTASSARTALGLGAAAVENLGGDIIDGAGDLVIKSSVNLGGSPTTTTQAGSDNSTKIATTAQVQAALTTAGPLLKANNLSDLTSLATALANLGFTTSGISANGSYTLPGGLIVKWGSDNQQLNPSTVTFGTAFPSNCWAVITTISNTTDGKRGSSVASISRTNFTYYTGEGAVGNESFNITWMAVGN